jgi:hypothetical protein
MSIAKCKMEEEINKNLMFGLPTGIRIVRYLHVRAFISTYAHHIYKEILLRHLALSCCLHARVV